MEQTLQRRISAKTLRTHLPRILLGALFLVPGTLKLTVPFEILALNYGAGEPFMASLRDTSYLFTLLALTQIVAGLLLLSNRFVPLALTLLAPIIVNIVCFHLFIVPSAGGFSIVPFARGFTISLLIVGLELLLVIRHYHVFTPFFQERFER